MYSDFYGRSFTRYEIKEAFDKYLEWCKKNNQKPEVTKASDINENNIAHVIYHAEIQGFDCED